MNKFITSSLLVAVALPQINGNSFFMKIDAPNASDNLLFTQGFLKGIFFKDFSSIETCMKEEGTQISEFLDSSISYFAGNNFDYILKGLSDLGSAGKEMLKALDPCKLSEAPVVDSISNVFIDPYRMNYVIGESVKVNEQEIFNQLKTGIDFYEGDAFQSGFNFGSAFLIVQSGGLLLKNADVSRTYDYMTGFTSMQTDNFGITNDDLYNKMDEIGATFTNLINDAYSNTQYEGQINLSLNKIGEAFVTSPPLLDEYDAITGDSSEDLVWYGNCLQTIQSTQISQEVRDLYTKSKVLYDESNLYQSGRQIYDVCTLLCPVEPDTVVPEPAKEDIQKTIDEQIKKFQDKISDIVDKIKDETSDIVDKAKDFLDQIKDYFNQGQ